MKRTVKKIIKTILPHHIKENLRANLKKYRNYLYDYNRFVKWSASEQKYASRLQAQALIIKEYHRIEKALALPDPRVPFGLTLVKELINIIQEYINKYEIDKSILISINVLEEYFVFHKERNFCDEALYKEFLDIKKKIDNQTFKDVAGGTLHISKGEIHKNSLLDLSGFFESRYSIRNFSGEEVDVETIKKAVNMARKTPSVCNRQSCRVHLYSDKKKILDLLQYQNGNSGFREHINKLLIITSDLQSFLNIGERYQCWIDGGMFSMSLVYALHSLGVGTCCLNWSVEYDMDLNVRQKAEINPSESIIMFIAIGHLPQNLKVAISNRKNLDHYLSCH